MVKAFLISLVLLLSFPAQNVSAQGHPKKQCAATTPKGTRCKNNALKNSKFCQVHQAKDPKIQQCKAKTKSGKRCSRAAKTAEYCQQHYKMYLEGKL